MTHIQNLHAQALLAHNGLHDWDVVFDCPDYGDTFRVAIVKMEGDVRVSHMVKIDREGSFRTANDLLDKAAPLLRKMVDDAAA